MPTGGYPVVLTGEIATMSDTFGSSIAGFASAIPDGYIRNYIAKLYFRIRSDHEGRVFRAPYGLAKVEAALIRYGFPRDKVIIASPYKLDKVIGPATKIVGIYVMDPLGLSFGSGILYWILRLANIPYRGIPYIARSFINVITHPAIRRHRNRLTLVVGGPAAWQLVDTGMQSKLGVDVVFEGEFEEYGPKIFEKIINGENVPNRIVVSKPVPIDRIPTILTPSIGGIVEVTRGCGRGCQFCTPTLSGMIRSIPFEGHIDEEIRLNIERGGAREITLHSDEFFRYGARGINPEPEKVIDLVRKSYSLVKSYGEEYRVVTDFTTAAVVVQAPKMVKEVGEYMNEGGEWSFIEMGIETGSPRMIKLIMPGKVLPHRAEDYPNVVEEAIGILNDSGWVVVGTMITNLPEETDDDVVRNLELLDRLKKLRVLTFPLPFIPMGSLRRRDFTVLDKVLEDPLRREFVLRALVKAFTEALRFRDLIVSKIENIVVRRIIKFIAINAFQLVLRNYMDELRKTVSRKSIQ